MEYFGRQQPSEDVRKAIELMQTCNRDLQHLIELRIECLPLLEGRFKALQRINEIIQAANESLMEMGRVIEKCRPSATQRSVSMMKRMMWTAVDAKRFRSHEPVISRHHAAILIEITYLRQILLMQSSDESGPGKNRSDSVSLDKGSLYGDGVESLKDVDVSPAPSSVVPVVQTSSDRARFTAELPGDCVPASTSTPKQLYRPHSPPGRLETPAGLSTRGMYSCSDSGVSALSLAPSLDVRQQRETPSACSDRPPPSRASSISTQRTGLFRLFGDPLAFPDMPPQVPDKPPEYSSAPKLELPTLGVDLDTGPTLNTTYSAPPSHHRNTWSSPPSSSQMPSIPSHPVLHHRRNFHGSHPSISGSVPVPPRPAFFFLTRNDTAHTVEGPRVPQMDASGDRSDDLTTGRSSDAVNLTYRASFPQNSEPKQDVTR